MTQTIQPRAQAIAVNDKNTVSPFLTPEKIDEKTIGEYEKILDSLCIVLEKYSTALVRINSEMIGHHSRMNELQINEVNKI